jgi:hypothetical protein
MATVPRELFPNLPPELRNEVYSYLSLPGTTSSASIFGLPLKLKMFECKHTTVELCAVHYGSTGLLALQAYRFAEAREYASWLLNNAMELRIGVTFKGRVNTFIQQDWDRKMVAHLRKLAKLHPWLKKVAKYNVQIFWSPVDGVLRSKKNKRTAGRIAKDIAAALTALPGADVQGGKGELNLKLCLDHKFAAETVISGTRFGFDEFLSPGTDTGGFRRQTREVWKEPYMKLVEEKAGARFLVIAPAQPEDRGLMVIEDNLVKWTIGESGHLVMRKEIVDGRVTGLVAGSEHEKDAAADHIAISLLGECL